MNESTIETIRQMTKPVRVAATAALIFLALFLAAKAFDAFGNLGRSSIYPSSTITVQGTGEATAIPDVARISFSVTEDAGTVAAAQEAATAKTDAALAALKDLDIEEADVKTLSYNVYPQYEYQNCYNAYCPPTTSSPKIIGYEVSQTIEVTVRDTAKAGDVLQALGTTEVQNISGPNFTVDGADSVKAEAREIAIAEAKEKAKMLAKELGVSLGKVVSFYEDQPYPMYDYGYGGDMRMESAAAQSAPTLPVGEQETSVTVSITYEIR
jgi:uncharacterized protein YggE